jgi:hypothetical protein
LPLYCSCHIRDRKGARRTAWNRRSMIECSGTPHTLHRG